MKEKDIELYPVVLTANEISQILRISKPTAYVLMEKPGFPLIRIGRTKRVLKDQFFHWIANNVSDSDNLIQTYKEDLGNSAHN